MGVPDPNRVQVLIDSILPMDQLMERGYNQAKLSGTPKRFPEDEDILKEYAVAIARDTHTDPYNPSGNLQDKLREQEYERLLERRNDIYIAKSFADEIVSKREDHLAELQGEIQQEPKLTRWIQLSAVLVLAGSVATTLHDRVFFNITDQLVAWAAAAVIAMLVGAFITWSLIGAIDTSGERTSINIGGLTAGILLGLGTAVLRIADVHAGGEYIFAAALTLIEVSVVIGLEAMGSRLRTNWAKWSRYEAERTKRSALLETAKSDSARRERQSENAESEVTRHMQYVELRWIKHHKVQDIETAAVQAILSGYHKGVAENRGRHLGVLVKIA